MPIGLKQILTLIMSFVFIALILLLTFTIILFSIPLVILYLLIHTVRITYIALIDWTFGNVPIQYTIDKEFRYLKHWWNSGTCE